MNVSLVTFFVIIIGTLGYRPVSGACLWDNDHLHPLHVNKNSAPPENYRDFISPPGEGETDWQTLGQTALQDAILQARDLLRLHHPAKNAIVFMGDGMGMSTHTAARVYMSQSRNLTGDSSLLSWEDFPYTALAKTYSTDYLVPDSASTATAIMCGEKCREAVICADQLTVARNCTSMQGNELTSVLHHAIDAGKWTGMVGTSAATGASLAVNYAHSPSRYWENDADMEDDVDTELCSDIASQLVEEEINNNIRVILAGGRSDFLPETMSDPEYPEISGGRKDGKNLIETWKQNVGTKSSHWNYVENLTDFNEVNTAETEFLMGLFEPGSMHYEVDRTNSSKNLWAEPSLTEMVEKAIEILRRGPQGYFLFVEAANIDRAHHGNNAFRALNDTVALSDAVARAKELTSEEDTLIIVTSDHSHTFQVSGYPAINTDIFKYNEEYERGWGFQYADDDIPYTTLVYSTGPGYYEHRQGDDGQWAPRKNLSLIKDQLSHPDQLQDSMIPLESGTHAGEDVPIHARGPMSYLLQGGQEQTIIAHVLNYAMCLGENREMCEDPPGLIDSCSNTGNIPHRVSPFCFTLVCLVALLKKLSSLE